MGADIYLESIHEAEREAWEPQFNAAVQKRDRYPRGSAMHERAQKRVDETFAKMYGAGYFRDCYNGYGLFAQTSLSWWRDVIPMLDENGYLPIDKAQELRERVARERIDLASAKKVAREQKDKPPQLAEYESWRGELLTILNHSISLGEPLRCSL